MVPLCHVYSKLLSVLSVFVQMVHYGKFLVIELPRGKLLLIWAPCGNVMVNGYGGTLWQYARCCCRLHQLRPHLPRPLSATSPKTRPIFKLVKYLLESVEILLNVTKPNICEYLILRLETYSRKHNIVNNG